MQSYQLNGVQNNYSQSCWISCFQAKPWLICGSTCPLFYYIVWRSSEYIKIRQRRHLPISPRQPTNIAWNSPLPGGIIAINQLHLFPLYRQVRQVIHLKICHFQLLTFWNGFLEARHYPRYYWCVYHQLYAVPFLHHNHYLHIPWFGCRGPQEFLCLWYLLINKNHHLGPPILVPTWPLTSPRWSVQLVYHVYNGKHCN